MTLRRPSLSANTPTWNNGLGAIAILSAVCLLLASPVSANVISGTMSGSANLTSTPTWGVYSEVFTATGSDTTFGSFTISSDSTFNTKNHSDMLITGGTFTEIFANGTLFGTDSGSAASTGNASSTFTITYVITGGTGAFAGDSGSFTLTGTRASTTNSSIKSVVGSYNGSLTVPIKGSLPAAVPEPSSLLLLVVGFVGLVVWQNRRPGLAS